MKIAIICCWLYDSKGEKLTYGGSQRYTLELAMLLKNQNHQVRIFQRATLNFINKYNDIPVIGLPVKSSAIGLIEYSKKTYQLLTKEELAIYVYQEVSFPYCHTPAIAVQHGLNWNANEKKRKFFNNKILQPTILKKLEKIVCVDTAYINWVLTEISSEKNITDKLYYIPNFVDNKLYKEKGSFSSCNFKNQKIVFFPRRTEKHRGVFLAYNAMRILWEKGEKYKIIFCGKGAQYDLLKKLVDKDKKKDFVEIIEKDFSEMPKEYAKANVTIIPTIAYEGTSFSCIESMAAGIPVISTYIGGLGNIVIPNLNGFCIPPNPELLAKYINIILENENLWNDLSNNSLEVAKALDIKNWQKKWIEIVNSIQI